MTTCDLEPCTAAIEDWRAEHGPGQPEPSIPVREKHQESYPHSDVSDRAYDDDEGDGSSAAVGGGGGRSKGSGGTRRRGVDVDREIDADGSSGTVEVWVRKRPIHMDEIAAGEFDVVTCVGATVVVHDARMHSDMQRQIMRHHEFDFYGTFDENTGNDEVFSTAVAGLVPLACQGRVATVMAYGQTGSGKTYTMSSIYAKAADALFRELNEGAAALDDYVDSTVSVSFLEISNGSCADLFEGGRSVKLVDGIAVGAWLTSSILSAASSRSSLVLFSCRCRCLACFFPCVWS